MTNTTHIDLHRPECNRTIQITAGLSWDVQMTKAQWEQLDALKTLEEVTEAELALFALEEMLLQEVTFDQAFRACVDHLAGRWEA